MLFGSNRSKDKVCVYSLRYRYKLKEFKIYYIGQTLVCN